MAESEVAVVAELLRSGVTTGGGCHGRGGGRAGGSGPGAPPSRARTSSTPSPTATRRRGGRGEETADGGTVFSQIPYGN